jgi:hypothetical protein
MGKAAVALQTRHFLTHCIVKGDHIMIAAKALGIGLGLACTVSLCVAGVGSGPGAFVQLVKAPLPSDDEIYRTVQDVVSFGVRVPGTQASRGVTQYIRDQFVASGLERVGFETATTKVWNATQWGLTVNGKVVTSYPIQHTMFNGTPGPFSTGTNGVKAPLVYVGKGTTLDFSLVSVKGKIVVMDVPFGSIPVGLLKPITLGVQDSQNTFPLTYTLPDAYAGGFFPFDYYRAMKAGAVAVIGVLVDHVEGSRYYNEAYQAYDPGKAMKIPGLWVSPKVGKSLIAQIKAGKASSVVATVSLKGDVNLQEGRAVYGYLPGMSDEVVLVQSHHDSSTLGAVEDASGTSEVLALARYYGQLPREQRPRTLMFATMETHFTDYAVHKAFANKYLRPGNPMGQRTVAGITIEHIGKEVVRDNNTGMFVENGRSVPKLLMISTEVNGLKEIAVGAMRNNQIDRTIATSATLVSTLVGGGLGLPADSSDFYRVGLPMVLMVGSPLYLYDDNDSLDKVDKANLGRVAKTFIDIIDGMGGIPSRDYKTLNISADF